jgi:hypothetical protein
MEIFVALLSAVPDEVLTHSASKWGIVAKAGVALFILTGLIRKFCWKPVAKPPEETQAEAK